MPVLTKKSDPVRPAGIQIAPPSGTSTVPAAPAGSGGLVTIPTLNPAFGNAVVLEFQNPANGDALWTVPANKTFTGTIVITGSFNGAVGVSAATGGIQAQARCTSTSVPVIDAEDVTIAGGGTGNALTAAISGTVAGSTIKLIGHWK